MQLMDKKVKDVPPGLFNLVKKEKKLKRGVLAILISLAVVALGLSGIYFLDELKELKDVRLTSTERVSQVPEKKEESVQEKKVASPPEPDVTKTQTMAATEKKEEKKTPEKGLRAEAEKKRISEKFKPTTEKKVPKKTSPSEKKPESADLSSEGDSGLDYLFRAYDYERQGLIRDAIAEYREYLKHSRREDPRILNKLAVLCLLDQDIKGAIYFSELALRNSPSDTTILLNYGVIKAKAGEHEIAEEIFKKILTFDSKNRNALFNLALLKEKKGELEEAEKLYSTLRELGDRSADESILRIRSQK